MVITVWFASALLLDRAGSTRVPSGAHYDAILVAGAGVLAGGRAGRPLHARVVRASQLYAAGVAPRIVMTGGVGRFPPAESVVATRLAIGMGVPDSAIDREERSTSTEENAQYAAALLGRSARVLVVTDRFHVVRSRRVFARHFAHADAVGTVCSPWPRFRGAMREVIAIAGYAALGRL